MRPCLCGMYIVKGGEKGELGSLKRLTRRGRQEQDPKGVWVILESALR